MRSDTMAVVPPKPPLGIMPQNVWRTHRAIELAAAIGRQKEHYEIAIPCGNEQRQCLLNIQVWAAELAALELGL
jgi:hypothetical protein